MLNQFRLQKRAESTSRREMEPQGKGYLLASKHSSSVTVGDLFAYSFELRYPYSALTLFMEHFSPFCTAWWLSFWDTTVYHNTAELVSKLLKFVIQFTSLKKDLAVFTGLPWLFVQKAKIYRQFLAYNIYCNFEAMRDVNEYRLILLKAT